MHSEFETKLDEIGQMLETLKDNDPEAYARLDVELAEHFDAILDILNSATGE